MPGTPTQAVSGYPFPRSVRPRRRSRLAQRRHAVGAEIGQFGAQLAARGFQACNVRLHDRHRQILQLERAHLLGHALEGMRAAVRAVRDTQGLELRTIREMNELFVAARADRLTDGETEIAAAALDANLVAMAEWVILPPHMATARIRAVAQEQIGTLRRLTLAG